MLELIKNFMVYGIGGVLSKLIVFLMIPIYTNKLSPEEYGYFDLLFTITTIAAVFGMLQLHTGFQRFYYEKDDFNYKRILISSVFWEILLLSSLVVLILVCFLVPISNLLFAGGYKIELLVVFFSVIITNLYSYFLCVLRFDNRPKTFAVISVLSALLNAGISIVFVVCYNWNVLGAVIGDFIAHSIVVIILFFVERDKIVFQKNKCLLKDIYKFSLPLFPAGLGGVANSYINRFFMISMFSAEAIGLYSLGLKIASAIFLVQTAFTLAWRPYLFKIMNLDGHKITIRKISYLSTLAMCYISIVLSLFSSEIVLIVSNDAYIGASPLVGFLALYNGLFLIKETVDIGVQFTKKSKYTSYLYFLSLLINIVGLLYFPKILGLEGVAMALLLSNVVLVITTMYISDWLYIIPLRKIHLIIIIGLTILILFVLNRVNLTIFIKIIVLILSIFSFIYFNKESLVKIFNNKKQW